MDCKRSVYPAQMAIALGFLVAMFFQIAQGVRPRTPNVTIYMSPSRGVLDLKWDMSPYNLEFQLIDLGMAVSAADDGQPKLTGDTTPDAYVIPFQNGNKFYASAEDMSEVTSYVAAGGLVILLDASSGEGAAVRDFVSQALSLQGDWYLCKDAAKPTLPSKHFILSHLGDGLLLSTWASAFLPNADLNAAATTNTNTTSTSGDIEDTVGSAVAPWPRRLEDARFVSTHKVCVHEDSALVNRPLYTVNGDDIHVAAQAFGKVGLPGAVVWLGYSWKDGAQEQWGELLKKIINDFAEGRYKAPSEEDAAWAPKDLGDQVVEAVAATGDVDLTDTLRRLLQGPGIYPPFPSSSEGNGNGNDNGNGHGNGNGNGNGHGNSNGNSNGNRRRALELPRIARRLRSVLTG